MNVKSPFCSRTFSQRSAYSQHTQICLRKVEVDEEESNSEIHTIDLTKDKLNNKAGNVIIQFFNKHSALSKSSLPKNIEKVRTFMNKMKFPNLSFNKICITYHNGKEYFLHYQSLIQCIENILAVPDITQNFALSFEKKEKVFIKNKITEYGGRIPKGLCQQAPNYYHLFYIRMQQLQIHWVKANYIRYIYQLVIFQRGVATNLMPNNF